MDTENDAYRIWHSQVDTCVQALAGVSLAELPHCVTEDWFAARVKPLSAARRALKQAGCEAPS